MSTPSPTLRELLEQAWSVEEAEREAWLREACGSDAELFERARSLLVKADPPDGFLATPMDKLLDTATSVAPPGQELAAGMRLGPWRLERELGRGGMGVVWSAERDDERFHRRVAIKVLHQASADRELELRFRRECALQASLDHPGIARLVDSGIGPGGRPFLVLELVEGVPLDQWLAREEPTLRRRLELFARICDAVHYAHQNLVVHRDLKPANVLVTREDEPKLLDFGIAKLMESDAEATWADLTRDEQRLFTPSYASPEQLRGEAAGIPSDVWALGVLFYELLVGERPFDLADASWTERLRVLTEERPEPPSSKAGTTEGGVAPERLAGDLDAIALFALRPEVEQRYGSAEAFGDDVRRHLDGHPVRARPDTALYRTSRFVARNRVAVAVAAAALVALLLSFALTLVQYLEAEDARTLAEGRLDEIRALADELEVERAEAVARAEELGVLSSELAAESERAQRRFDDVRRFATDLVFDVHRLLLAVPGSIAARERVLEIGSRHLATLSEEAADDPELAAELVGAWLRLGDAQGDTLGANVGDLAAATESYTKALELARELSESGELEPARTARLLLTASFRRADAHRFQGEPELARLLLESALDEARMVAASDTSSRQDLYVAAIVLDRATELAIQADDAPRAHALLDELTALDRRRAERFGEDPSQAEARRVLAWRAADLDRRAGDSQAALRRTRAVLDELMAARVGDGFDRMYTIARSEVARDLRALGRAAEAVELRVANVGELEEVVRAQPFDARAKMDLAINLAALAATLWDAGRPDESVEPALRAVELALELRELDPSNQEVSQLLTVESLDTAILAARAGRPLEARLALEHAREDLARRIAERPDWFDLWQVSRRACGMLAELLRESSSPGAALPSEWRDLARTASTLFDVHAADPRVAFTQEEEALLAELVAFSKDAPAGD